VAASGSAASTTAPAPSPEQAVASSMTSSAVEDGDRVGIVAASSTG
jgi:hypothetical protein